MITCSLFVSFVERFQSRTRGVDCAVGFCWTSEEQFVKIIERHLL